MKSLNITPTGWGLYISGNSVERYAAERGLTINRVLADIADDLNNKFTNLAASKKWQDITFEEVDGILRRHAQFGAVDSDGATQAADLLIALYGLEEQMCKERAYNQFRYPAN